MDIVVKENEGSGKIDSSRSITEPEVVSLRTPPDTPGADIRDEGLFANRLLSDRMAAVTRKEAQQSDALPQNGPSASASASHESHLYETDHEDGEPDKDNENTNCDEPPILSDEAMERLAPRISLNFQKYKTMRLGDKKLIQ